MKKTELSFSEFLTIHEVSQILKCNPATLRNWDRQGILKAIRIGKRQIRRYRREDIDQYVNQTKINKYDLGREIVFPQFTDATPDPILITDTTARIYYVNPAWEKLTGYTLDEIKGENPRLLQSGKTPRRVYRSLWKNLTKGQAFSTREFINKKKSGEEFQVHSTYFPIIKDGKPAYYVQMSHDISRQVEFERQKDAFIGIASHELKTPITTLFAYAQILQKRLAQKDDEKDLTLLSHIIQETKRLTNLIDDLLNVSRLESGKMALQPEVFDLTPLVQQVVNNIGNTTETHKIKIEGSTQKDVIGDKDKIDQVITNLLTNAVKYSPQADTVIVRLLNDRHHAFVSVQDFGFGIAEEDQPHIFKRFYRTKNKDERKIKGFGLGLYITSEIVKKHKGKIWVESKIDKGSTFYFSLPLAKSKQNG